MQNANVIPKVDFEVVLTRFERIWKPIISRGVVNSMLGIYVFEYDTINWKKKCINFNTVEFMPQNEVTVKFSLKDVNPKGFIIMPVTYGEGIKGPFLIMAKCKTKFTFTQLEDNFDISETAVKKQARIMKSVIKLDKNFHVYVHGKRDMITRGYDHERQMRYYQLYFNEED